MVKKKLKTRRTRTKTAPPKKTVKKRTARKTAVKKVAKRAKSRRVVKKKRVIKKRRVVKKKRVIKKRRVVKKKRVIKKRRVVKKSTTASTKKTARRKPAPRKKKKLATKKRGGTPRKKETAKRKKTTARKAAVKTPARRRPKKKPSARMVKSDKGAAVPAAVKAYQLKSGEPYMSSEQLQHFRKLLLNRKKELMREVDRTVNHMQAEATSFADPVDRATQEEEFSLELRARDRERKLIKKIDEAMGMIDADEYGYCVLCGTEIGVRRLEARPTATLCIDCKSLQELKEKQIAD